MDVLQLLDNELRTKSNWGLEEKARYLYIRSCQLFSFDERYYNTIFESMYGPLKLRDEIVLKEINLRNVTDTDFLVVCTRYSRYIFKRFLEELLGIEVDIDGNGHEYNLFEINKNGYIADATDRNDLARVKMGLMTYGYYNLDVGKNIYSIKLEQIDKKIEYIKDEYFEEKLKRRINNLENEYYKVTGKRKKDDKVSYLLFQMKIIKEIFDEINTFRQYSDASYCVEYLLDKFFGKNSPYFRNNNLLNITSDGIWNFINILDINYRGENFSFALEPVDGKYEFYEISIIEGYHYKKELLKESDFCK